jgi:hypothetical protein
MNIDKELVTALGSTTGLKIYPIKKPLKASVPCIVYRRVSSKPTLSVFKNLTLTRERFQIIATHTTYTGLRTLVDLIEGELICNKTDWAASVPTDIKLEDFDEENGVWSCSRDYFIYFN